MIMALLLIDMRKKGVRSVLVQENGGACLIAWVRGEQNAWW